jgi:hypothetical protein
VPSENAHCSIPFLGVGLSCRGDFGGVANGLPDRTLTFRIERRSSHVSFGLFAWFPVCRAWDLHCKGVGLYDSR